MLGLEGEAVVGRIPHPVHRAVLRVLRPAESAMRRLIVIAARGLVVKLAAPSRPMPRGGQSARAGAPVPPSSSSIRGYTSQRQRRRKARQYPRASFSSGTPDSQVDDLWPCAALPVAAPAPPPDGLINAAASAGGSRPSSPPLMICRARPGAWPAGG